MAWTQQLFLKYSEGHMKFGGRYWFTLQKVVGMWKSESFFLNCILYLSIYFVNNKFLSTFLQLMSWETTSLVNALEEACQTQATKWPLIASLLLYLHSVLPQAMYCVSTVGPRSGFFLIGTSLSGRQRVFWHSIDPAILSAWAEKNCWELVLLFAYQSTADRLAILFLQMETILPN